MKEKEEEEEETTEADEKEVVGGLDKGDFAAGQLRKRGSEGMQRTRLQPE